MFQILLDVRYLGSTSGNGAHCSSIMAEGLLFTLKGSICQERVFSGPLRNRKFWCDRQSSQAWEGVGARGKNSSVSLT